jgi:hypothetical protein
MRQARIGVTGPDSKDVQAAAAEWHAGGELRKLCDRVAQESTRAGESSIGRLIIP